MICVKKTSLSRLYKYISLTNLTFLKCQAVVCVQKQANPWAVPETEVLSQVVGLVITSRHCKETMDYY